MLHGDSVFVYVCVYHYRNVIIFPVAMVLQTSLHMSSQQTLELRALTKIELLAERQWQLGRLCV